MINRVAGRSPALVCASLPCPLSHSLTAGCHRLLSVPWLGCYVVLSALTAIIIFIIVRVTTSYVSSISLWCPTGGGVVIILRNFSEARAQLGS